jgi:hypothetical protein
MFKLLTQRFWGVGILLGLLGVFCFMPLQALADDFDDYGTSAGTEAAAIDLPTISAGYAMVVDYFPAATTEVIDDQFEAAGRLIAAEGKTVYLQRTYGSGVWDAVATVPDTMDPSFIHVSPDGSLIALGLGYGQPLLIVPTSVLSVSTPPDLTDSAEAPGVISFENVSYYDGDWKDNRYFIVDGGSWPGSDCTYPYHDDPDCVFYSGVGAVDTQDSDPENHTGVLLATHDGASADVEVTADGELLIGIGWYTSPTNRTGEIKVWADGEWDPTTPNSLDYESNTRVLAENLLSAAWMGQDAEGNLHVGGGDAFGTGGTDENGYAALIEEQVVGDIAAGIRTASVSDGNRTDNTEYKYFAPDPYEDDSATGILAGDWGRGLAVMWNSSGTGSQGSATDYWMTGVTPSLTVYYPGSAPDGDGDAIPDASDNAYLTANAGQEDTDGDGYGNAADGDFNNDDVVNYSDFTLFRSNMLSSEPEYDMNSDGTVNYSDFTEVRSRMLTSAPWY